MNTIVKTSLALVAAGLLSTSALASSGTQDTSFLKKDKEMVAEQPAKDKFFALEATYQFNNYKPKYENSSRTSDDFKDSGSFGLGAGMMVNKNLSVDGMLSYIPKTDFNFNSGSDTYRSDVTTTKLMFNGTFMIDTPMEAVSPYITAGLGTAYNQFSATVADGTKYTKDQWDFAYQAGAGVSYKLANATRINLGYRFADNGEAYKVPGVTAERLQSNSVVLGIQVPF